MATQDLLRSLIEGVTVETTVLPTVTVKDPFAPGPPNPLLQLLKPRITVAVAGSQPLVIAPYGDPGPTRWPVVKLVAFGLLGVGALLVLRRVLR